MCLCVHVPICVWVCVHMHVLLSLVSPSLLTDTRKVLSLYLNIQDCLVSVYCFVVNVSLYLSVCVCVRMHVCVTLSA